MPATFSSGQDMFAVFYEQGLCAVLGGEKKQEEEGGTASLCHQSNFWDRLEIGK